jgi:hypothetical protein
MTRTPNAEAITNRRGDPVASPTAPPNVLIPVEVTSGSADGSAGRRPMS